VEKEGFRLLSITNKLSFFVMIVLWEIEGARVLKLIDSVGNAHITLNIVLKSIHYDSVTIWVSVIAFITSILQLFLYEEKIFAIVSLMVSSFFLILIGVLIYWHF